MLDLPSCGGFGRLEVQAKSLARMYSHFVGFSLKPLSSGPLFGPSHRHVQRPVGGLRMSSSIRGGPVEAKGKQEWA